MLLGTRILNAEEGGYRCGMGQSEEKKDSMGGEGECVRIGDISINL